MPIVKPASFTARRRISFGELQVAMVPPALVKGATAGTGGTFGAGSAYWVLTATDADGETLKSNEITSVMTATSTQALTWAAVTGATGYKLYRGITVSGTYTTLVAALGLVTAYTDLGNAGTVASPPLVATDVVPIVYAAGAAIPNTTIKKLTRLSALLSSRAIIPGTDLFNRKTKLSTPTPTDMSPSMKGTL